MLSTNCDDRTILNLWHPIAAVDETLAHCVHRTVLLRQPLAYSVDQNGSPIVWAAQQEHRAGADISDFSKLERFAARIDYGYIWASLGEPDDTLFEIPEYAETDRRNISAGTVGVNVSAPRAVENFIDMGHFPYVHTNYLGVEPHTEVKEYQVSEQNDEILATECRFFQPMSAPSALGGMETEYVYRVPHPFCVMLYKTSPLDESRRDVIALFNQPIDHEYIRGHMLLSMLDETSSDTGLRDFQQTIFGQDKPILENQFPKRLPLDPRAETPIRADKSAIYYRRWLQKKGITYGVIPVAA